MIKHPMLTIVIPAYCEERRIGRTLDELSMFLHHDSFFRQKAVEVLVVAAEAPDSTQEIVRTKQELFKNLKLLLPGSRVGKGRDVQYGMQHASGDYIVFMDADLATPLYHVQEFYTLCLAGNDVVIGTRDLLRYRRNVLRGLFAWIGNRLYQLGSGIWVEDTQCGFKMFSAEAARLCFSKQTTMGWGFDIEILAIAKVNKLRIKPVRIDDWKHMPYSTYTDGALRITLRSIRDFYHVSYRRLSGAYRR